jgi:hypothetical protein
MLLISRRAGVLANVSLLRIGRLIGVVLKQPFAMGLDLASPSQYSGAYRAWELEPEAKFQNADVRDSWQYHALESLRTDPDVISTLGWQPANVYDLAQTAHHERGFFSFLAVSCRKYLCKDKKLRGEIDRQVKASKSAGFNLKNVTPETVVASGGLAIGTLLVQSVPVLGIMGAPVIAGIVLIIYTIGMDAFCSWASDRALREYDPAKQKRNLREWFLQELCRVIDTPARTSRSVAHSEHRT